MQDMEEELHPRADYQDLTQDTKDSGLCNVRKFSAVCVPQNKETSVENAT